MLLNVSGGHVWIGEIPTTADGRRTDGEDLSLAGKLTARGVESFAKRKGRYGDGDGLFLRVMDPGKRVYWTFRYRMNGQDREMSVGPYPELSLAQARDRHLALRNAVKVDKTDPLGDRRAAKTAVIARSASAKPTFGQCAEQFIALNEGAWRSRKNAAQWRQSLARHCQPIWSRPVDLITAEDVLAVLEPIWPTVPETASRVRGRIEKILNAARVRGHIAADKANPARWKDHLKDILPSPKKLGSRGHHAAMPYAEVPAFMARLKEIDTTAARALMITVLTCARSGEALGATFDEIDFNKAVWTVPETRMKKGKEHQVPLSDPALAILRRQHDVHGSNPHVFPGRPMRSLSPMSMHVLLRRLKVDATVHGFRSAARSWMADQGVAFELAEACLAHQVGNAVVQAYQRSSWNVVAPCWPRGAITSPARPPTTWCHCERRGSEPHRDQPSAPPVKGDYGNAVWASTANHGCAGIRDASLHSIEPSIPAQAGAASSSAYIGEVSAVIGSRLFYPKARSRRERRRGRHLQHRSVGRAVVVRDYPFLRRQGSGRGGALPRARRSIPPAPGRIGPHHNQLLLCPAKVAPPEPHRRPFRPGGRWSRLGRQQPSLWRPA